MTFARASECNVKMHNYIHASQNKAGDISDAIGFQGGLIIPRNDQSAIYVHKIYKEDFI